MNNDESSYKKIEQLENRIFSLEFEVKAMSENIFNKTSERWVEGYCDASVSGEHFGRYNWACQYVTNKNVLDIASGIGKGSNLLATNGKARTVVGVDICDSSVRYSKIKYSNPNLNFLVGDADKFRSETKFDIIISFETIEHVSNVEDFLVNIKYNLAPNGFFIVSTPISEEGNCSNPVNIYHEREWGLLEFQKLLKNYFDIKEVFVQKWEKGQKDYSPVLFKSLKKRLFSKVKLQHQIVCCA